MLSLFKELAANFLKLKRKQELDDSNQKQINHLSEPTPNLAYFKVQEFFYFRILSW
jgi:hypothetical protein